MYQYKDDTFNEGLKDVLDSKEDVYTDKDKVLDDTKRCTSC